MARRKGGGFIIPVELDENDVLTLDVGGHVREERADGSTLEADEDERVFLHPGEEFEGHTYLELLAELE